MIVVDANVVVYALTESPEQALARAAAERDADWRAPRLWRSEVRNALTTQMRQRGMPVERVIQLAEAAELLVIDEDELAMRAVLEVAGTCRLTAYDCEYVALAQQLGVKLITNDGPILAAFPDIAVSLSAFAAGAR